MDAVTRRGSAPAGPEAPAYRLVRAARLSVTPVVLDPAQRAVVDHRGGPLLVLAGPGTGKTTTIVEAVAARIDAGADPESILVLTFGRKAAAQLRERISARLGRATKEPLARTFHSYAFGLLRREAAASGGETPRLLSGPEQDLVVRELLRGDIEIQDAGGQQPWPPRLRPALPTRGFAQELRDLMMRAYERGVTPPELARLGREHGRDDWVAVARFSRQYSGVSALRESEAYDPAELIRAVVGMWLRDDDVLARERAERAVVFVDEMQDTDPAQIELLRLLCGGGRELVAVGDPDQSIYGFRGAEVSGLTSFSETFRTATDEPAPVRALVTSRRSGAVLLAATRRVAIGLGGPVHHRDLRPADGVPSGEVQVDVLRSESQEAQHVAAHLRAAHLIDGVPWSQMAVVVRSTARSMPVLARAMSAAGVPVAVARDELPLVAQPAVRPLLLALECAVRPDRLDEDAAVELVTSALGGADVMGLRRLRKEMRRAELAGGGVRASGELLVEALADPRVLIMLDDWAVRPASRVAALLRAGREVAEGDGATAEDVLWALWSRSGLAARWQRMSAGGGRTGDSADRDLDAVVALFETAAKFCDRLPAAGPELFLDHLRGQEIPSDSLAPRAAHDDAVQVLTAHAAKGLEWDVVCVAAVQEGSWPDLRMRGSFLGSERLVDVLRGAEPLAPSAANAATLNRLLAEERRLFYVAVTRAARRVLVTAVASEREGLSPSRFLDELDPLPAAAPAGENGVPAEAPTRAVTQVERALSLAGLVGELRQAVTDPDTDPGVARGAAEELARLAAAGVRGADPSTWWGLPKLSDDRPVLDPDEQVRVSPSRVDAFLRCQLRWFLEQVGASGSSSTAQSIGTLVHAVAEEAVDAATSGEQALLARLDELLPTVELGRGWAADQHVTKARAMVRRLALWLAANPRTLVAAETRLEATVGRAVISGQVDRLERDSDGRAIVIDLKTGSSKVDESELAQHGQLAAYQLAVEQGGFADLGLEHSGGAMLVQVGKAGVGAKPREQRQLPLADADDPGWASELVAEVSAGMAGSAFDAMVNKHCTICPVRTSCPLQDEGRQMQP